MRSLPDPSRPASGFLVCRDGEPVPPGLRGAAVAVGNFDGVHLGHRALIRAAEALARGEGRPAAVLTFEPHPRAYFRPESPVFRLTPEPVKLATLSRLGLAGAFVRAFDARLAATGAEDFVAGILKGELEAGAVVVGHDFRFGRAREGDAAGLERLARAHGLGCRIVPAVARDGVPVSSSLVRAALERGDVAGAAGLLGHRWWVAGEVRHGEKRGRTLGFPTANLDLGEGCRLAHGIYAVRVALAGGGLWDGVASYGRRPTFDNGAALLETHLFDFAGDLYGGRIEVEFAAWIRGEERFESAEALTLRMREDAAEARAALARPLPDGVRSLIGA